MRVLPSECVVYGAGDFGRQLADDLVASGTTVHALLDQSRTDYHGDIAVQPLDRWSDRRGAALIGIFNAYVDPLVIRQDLYDAGFDEVWLPTEARLALGRIGFDRLNYWLADKPDRFRGDGEEVEAARSLWSDDVSRAIFDDLLTLRFTGEHPSDLRIDASAVQYQPSDLQFLEGDIRLVDCGAFDGDTIEQFVSGGFNIARLAAFEPDPINYARLVDKVRDFGLDAAVFPVGVYSSAAQLRFEPGGTSANIQEQGELLIQCVALDDCIQGFQPTHVKMDIEGAELEALRGMRGIMSSDAPSLAICVYHRPDDLWKIPLEIASAVPGRPLYLRLHGYLGFEAVAYSMDQ